MMLRRQDSPDKIVPSRLFASNSKQLDASGSEELNNFKLNATSSNSKPDNQIIGIDSKSLLKLTEGSRKRTPMKSLLDSSSTMSRQTPNFLDRSTPSKNKLMSPYPFENGVLGSNKSVAASESRTSSAVPFIRSPIHPQWNHWVILYGVPPSIAMEDVIMRLQEYGVIDRTYYEINENWLFAKYVDSRCVGLAISAFHRQLLHKGAMVGCSDVNEELVKSLKLHSKLLGYNNNQPNDGQDDSDMKAITIKKPSSTRKNLLIHKAPEEVEPSTGTKRKRSKETDDDDADDEDDIILHKSKKSRKSIWEYLYEWLFG